MKTRALEGESDGKRDSDAVEFHATVEYLQKSRGKVFRAKIHCS